MAPPCKGRFVYLCIEIRLQPPRRPDPPGTAGCLAIPRFCKRLFPDAFRDGALTPAIGGTLKDQDMISGTVKFYNTTNGFGFIAQMMAARTPLFKRAQSSEPAFRASARDRRFPTTSKMARRAAWRRSTSDCPDGRLPPRGFKTEIVQSHTHMLTRRTGHDAVRLCLRRRALSEQKPL